MTAVETAMTTRPPCDDEVVVPVEFAELAERYTRSEPTFP